MKKSELFELRKKVGNPASLFGAVDCVINDGPAKGVRVFHVRNGKGLEATVAADRGLDIPHLIYKGVNMGFASKTGMRSPYLYVEDGVRGFLKQFYAGLMTTCGITYSGAPCKDAERDLGLHGPYSNTPAGECSARVEYEGDDAVIIITGKVREACVFEENMQLTRQMKIYTEKDEIEVTDRVENLGFADQPSMMVYHINFGYPMLDAGAKVYTNAANVEPRDEWAKTGPGTYDVIDEPEIGRAEQCYFHTEFKGDSGIAMIHNEKLGLAAAIEFDRKAFPILCEWKCMMAGDYALGLEPTAAGVMGREYAREKGILPIVKPGECADYKFKLSFLDDKEAISKMIEKM
ncbi:MAG: aldose 1-epimerase family protein [Clostridia bacterium]|nr:aldose 1-epimerase family protein [Clostridia bacterium]